MTDSTTLLARYSAGLPVSWRNMTPVAGVVAVAAIVHLAVATRYGWHTDEFYYVVCGQHPAWGYFDHPPLVPLLARAAALGGLWGLRLLAIAVHLACIVLAALLAAELGGRRVAQVLTAVAVAASPLFMGAAMFFGTTVVDQLVWIAVLLLVTRALRIGTVLAWLPAGVAAGIGLEAKQTVVLLLIGIGIGLAIFRRDALRGAGPWTAIGVAAVLAAPNLIWNASHGWPSLTFAHAMSLRMGGMAGSLSQMPLLLLLYAGPMLVVLWLGGIGWLASPEGEHHRWLLAVPVVVVALVIISGGRCYYVGPVFAVLFAAGAMRIEARNPDRLPPGWAVALVGLFAGAAMICLPMLSVTTADSLRKVNPIPLETYGWRQFVDEVAAAATSLPEDVPIFTSDYGEASALRIFGSSAGINRPVVSGDSNYAVWGPPPGDATTVLCVGRFPVRKLTQYWAHVTYLASITIPDGVHNGLHGAHIYLCEQPRGSWAAMWPRMRHSSGVAY
ncbi:glycosyltransferase family 39 protein [[Mycobacterium] holstebronense]|uniref:Glycosyltransferase family 39 protein n=1 Tax=[Mycobacterium] holstebronense TaxID=3064288 RepID=A0ABM9M0J6_9MYCO|nr:glycosyltransferase family 39 protein [Mycolicibacter sp. MU0102]CAJ1507997.1 glycosyltransferase family 39 protein [Mycolicibacter sp. MU0102]